MYRRFAQARDRQRRGRPRSHRPRFEVLEDRRVPSTVTNLMDSGPGSLRQAILDTSSGGTVDFQPGLSGTITLTSGELAINKDLTIAGPGPSVLTVSGNNASRVLDIAATFTVNISGLTIANGHVNANYGGGGIFTAGNLTLTDCTLSGNSGSTTTFVLGGGIYNTGSLTITACTLSGNSVHAVSPIAAASGGGVANFGHLIMTTSTLSGNTATSIGSNSPTGGGILNDNSATAVVVNSTLSGNSVSGGNGGIGGGIGNFAGTVTVANSIIGGNTAHTGPDVSGALSSQGYNLIGDGSGGSGYDPTDLVGTSSNPIDPLLGPLQDNGGPTQTMALLPGSPALDAGDPGQLEVADQRGVLRTGGVNIGAYQASATALAVAAPDAVQAGVPFDVTVSAVDPFGQAAVGYTGTVTFGTTDTGPGVVLPADYAFTAADAGMHTFSDTGLGETTLVTAGPQALTVTDTSDGTITGSATVTVTGPDIVRPAPSPGLPSASALAAMDLFFAARHAEQPGLALW